MLKNESVPVLPPEGFVRLPIIIGILGISKTSWWRGVRDGRFPRSVKLAPRTTAWRVEDIRALIASFEPSATSAAAEKYTEPGLQAAWRQKKTAVPHARASGGFRAERDAIMESDFENVNHGNAKTIVKGGIPAHTGAGKKSDNVTPPEHSGFANTEKQRREQSQKLRAKSQRAVTRGSRASRKEHSGQLFSLC